MRIYNIIGTIYNPQETKGGIAFNMSLGKDSGFCRIVWTWKARFNFELKDKQTVVIPSANMTLTDWTNKDGVTKTQLTIFTNYLEPFVSPFIAKPKEDIKPKQGYKESVDKTLQEFNTINWDEELGEIQSSTNETQTKNTMTYEEEKAFNKAESDKQDMIVKLAKQKLEEEEEKMRMESLKNFREGE